jgi:hypothetical protein
MFRRKASAYQVSCSLRTLRRKAGELGARLANATASGMPPSDDDLAALAAIRRRIADLERELNPLLNIRNVVNPLTRRPSDEISRVYVPPAESADGPSEATPTRESSSRLVDWQDSLYYGVAELMSLGNLGAGSLESYTVGDTARSSANAS